MPTPPQQPITEAQAAATLAACAKKNNVPAGDAIDNSIRAASVAHGINTGYTAAELSRTGRMSGNMGQCVADAYDPNKKEGFWEGVGNKISNLTNQFTTSAGTLWNGVKEDAKLVGGQAVMSGVSAVTNDTPQVIRDSAARTQQAAAMVR